MYESLFLVVKTLTESSSYYCKIKFQTGQLKLQKKAIKQI